MRLATVLATFTLFATAPAWAVDYRWVVGTGQGTVEASIRNKDGGRFTLFCGSGTDEKRSGIILEGVAAKAPKGQPVDVQVIVDGENHVFRIKDGYGPVDARGARLELQRLAQALVASRARTFTVEYPSLDAAETYPLANVRDAVRDGKKTIVTPCL